MPGEMSASNNSEYNRQYELLFSTQSWESIGKHLPAMSITQRDQFISKLAEDLIKKDFKGKFENPDTPVSSDKVPQVIKESAESIKLMRLAQKVLEQGPVSTDKANLLMNCAPQLEGIRQLGHENKNLDWNERKTLRNQFDSQQKEREALRKTIAKRVLTPEMEADFKKGVERTNVHEGIPSMNTEEIEPIKSSNTYNSSRKRKNT